MNRITLLSALFLTFFMISASGCEKMQPADLSETGEVEDVATQTEGVQMAAPAQSSVGTIVVNETPFSSMPRQLKQVRASSQLSGNPSKVTWTSLTGSLPDSTASWKVKASSRRTWLEKVSRVPPIPSPLETPLGSAEASLLGCVNDALLLSTQCRGR